MLRVIELNNIFSFLPTEINYHIYDYYIDLMRPEWQEEHKKKFNSDTYAIILLQHNISIDMYFCEDTHELLTTIYNFDKDSVLLEMVYKTRDIYLTLDTCMHEDVAASHI